MKATAGKLTVDRNLFDILFKEKNDHNTIKQAYLLIIKWLFDNRFLLLPDNIYTKGLSFASKEIREFLFAHLHNHIWVNQSNRLKEPAIPQFLFNIDCDRDIELINEEKMNEFARNLFLKEAGVREEYLRIYNEDYNYENHENLEKSIFLNE